MIDRRFPSFLLAGGVNTLAGYALYGALVLAGLAPHVALIFSTIGGILFNFLTTGTVFRSRDPRLLPRFVGVYGGMLALNMLLLDLAMRAGIGPLIGQGLVVLVCAPLNFLAMRRFVFAPPPEQAP
ncbi:MAG: GtrA family protein [Sphingobium sp.]